MNFRSFFKAENLFAFAALIVASTALAYGAYQYRFFEAVEKARAGNEALTARVAKEIAARGAEYRTFAESANLNRSDLDRTLARILPPDENYIDLTQDLDAFFARHDSASNPIFQSSLGYSKGAPVADIPGISALPFTMNLEATRANFSNFLDYIRNSGSLETGARLMSIESIQMNFPQEGEELKNQRQTINFTVKMNAYYVTPKGIKNKIEVEKSR